MSRFRILDGRVVSRWARGLRLAVTGIGLAALMPQELCAQYKDIRALRPTRGYGYAWQAPLQSAPSMFRWRFAVNLPKGAKSIEAGLAALRDSQIGNRVVDARRLSASTPRPLGPTLFDFELSRATALPDLIAYRVSDVPADEAELQRLFEFLEAMKFEVLIVDGNPGNLSRLDLLAQQNHVKVAVCGMPNDFRSIVESRSDAIGLCVKSTDLLQDKGILQAQPIASRIVVLEVENWSRPELRQPELFSRLYDARLAPSLIVLNESDGSVESMAVATAAVNDALRPVVIQEVLRVSKLPDGGRAERAAANASVANFTAGNSARWLPVTPDRRRDVESALPVRSIVRPKKPRKLLVLDLNIGYPGHASIPTHDFALRRLGEKTGAYSAVFSNDMDNLTYPRIKAYDAILLNNTVGLIFSDPRVREGLLRYVREGGGLAAIHAANNASLDWPDFGALLGTGYPGPHKQPTEKIWLHLDDPASPLNAGFTPEARTIQDETFRMTDPSFSRSRVHVLLSIDIQKTDMAQPEDAGSTPYKITRDDDDYAVSWVRREGEGRVFYTTMGHNPTLFADPRLARHMLGAIQYVLGDLALDDKPDGSAGPAATNRASPGQVP